MPCGSAFAIETAEQKSPDLIHVSLHQTETVLLQRMAKTDTEESRAHRHEALTLLAESLDAPGAAVDFTGLRFEFGQPLPKGLMPVVISRCALLCGEETSVFRRDLEGIITTDGIQMEVSLGQQGPSSIVLMARCRAGHEALCQQQVQLLLLSHGRC